MSWHAPLILLAAAVAGFVNAVAGGGTFLAFPALTSLGGLSEKAANIACTLGLWPGSAASVLAVRREVATLPRRMLVGYAVACLAGGAVGAELLLHTQAAAFRQAIPWLLLFATVVFALGQRIAKWSRREAAEHPGGGWPVFVGAVQLLVSVYGGYFGAGMGVLTLAGLSLAGLPDLKQPNVLKVCLSTATNLTAAVVFAFGPVPWRTVNGLAVASTVGGFAGMIVAQRLPAGVLRWSILGAASALTAAYFWQVYGPGR